MKPPVYQSAARAFLKISPWVLGWTWPVSSSCERESAARSARASSEAPKLFQMAAATRSRSRSGRFNAASVICCVLAVMPLPSPEVSLSQFGFRHGQVRERTSLALPLIGRGSSMPTIGAASRAPRADFLRDNHSALRDGAEQSGSRSGRLVLA